jgi:hypothetical protein
MILKKPMEVSIAKNRAHPFTLSKQGKKRQHGYQY